ncbi:MAG TPA: nicotinate phosphoribosyltransferase [Steroidobacteraceae bacterium]|nr:nicotinate phosphoribosyltransferase [Steroidobacteraceae bacterium]
MNESALVTDLYQLTMLTAYRRLGMTGEAVFELYARRLPPERGFLLVAGLEQALHFLETLAVTEAERAWLASLGRFEPDFLDWLGRLRFTGEVWAPPEGTVLFADEPWLRVVAPLPEAQLVESRLINLMHLETLIASKAARCVLAAGGRTLIDFGMRRAHGAEAALLAARAAVIAGFAGTATVAAGREFGLPLYGTMAHSFVQAHDTERDAFAGFARVHPDGTTLLIDTYDTLAAAREVVALVRGGAQVGAVRIDSGDLGEGARAVRAVLDEGGCRSVKILASGNLDEHELARLTALGAPIDAYGIGTRLDTSADAPYLDCAYKLEEYAGRPRRKRSWGKATWPGRKQVYRRLGSDGRIAADVVAIEGEAARGEPLLECVMREGRRLRAPESIAALAARAARSLATLPESCRALERPVALVAEISAGVRALAARVDQATDG